MSALPGATFASRTPGGRRADEADVGDEQLVAAAAREHADGASRRAPRRRSTCAETSASNRLVPWRDVAVVGGADEHAGAQLARRRARR